MFNVHNFMQSLQQETVRDLAWALFCPDLLISPDWPNFTIEPTAQRLQWLQQLDKKHDGLPLIQAQRLGRYYEALWAYFFTHDQQYQIVAHNLPIRKQNITVGELDFIVRDRFTNCLIHLEIAVKFYIFQADSSRPTITNNSQWPGPNSSDNLGSKWEKLTRQQIQLCQHEETKIVLINNHITNSIDEPLQPAISLKGHLFRPENTQQEPDLFNPANCIHSSYRQKDFLEKFCHTDYLGIIPKYRWLTTVHRKTSITLDNATNIVQQLNTRGTPIMAACFIEKDNDWAEIQRFFILPDNWP